MAAGTLPIHSSLAVAPKELTAGKSVVLFSDHIYSSKRRAGFHWLASAYASSGFNVTFVTTGVSHLGRLVSFLRPDPKYGFINVNNTSSVVSVERNIQEYVLLGLAHPLSLKGLGAWLPLGAITASEWMRRFAPIEKFVRSADRIVFESSPGLLLAEYVREINKTAAFIYRVSDSLKVVGAHPSVVVAERLALRHFSIVSVPSPLMAEQFEGHRCVRYHPHGIDKKSFDWIRPNPYVGPKKNIISVGSMLFDRASAELIAASRNDIHLHVFGETGWKQAPSNVTLYGERPFNELISYIQHADVAVALYRQRIGYEYLAHTSNKILQYMHVGLPIVVPMDLTVSREGFFGYQPASRCSIEDALTNALEYGRREPGGSAPPDWTELVTNIEADLVDASDGKRGIRS